MGLKSKGLNKAARSRRCDGLVAFLFFATRFACGGGWFVRNSVVLNLLFSEHKLVKMCSKSFKLLSLIFYVVLRRLCSSQKSFTILFRWVLLGRLYDDWKYFLTIYDTRLCSQKSFFLRRSIFNLSTEKRSSDTIHPCRFSNGTKLDLAITVIHTLRGVHQQTFFFLLRFLEECLETGHEIHTIPFSSADWRCMLVLGVLIIMLLQSLHHQIKCITTCSVLRICCYV